MKSILDTEKGREIVEQVTLKNVKLDIGHDLAGMYADFYLKGKKMGYFSDDGNRGETDVVYLSPAHQKEFEKFLSDNKVAQLMFENGWDFLKDIKKIDLHCQAENVIDETVNLQAIKKFQKKIEKNCLKSVIVGTDKSCRLQCDFRTPMKEMVTSYGDEAIALIQRAYDNLKSQLQKGERILNTNLKELGIKL